MYCLVLPSACFKVKCQYKQPVVEWMNLCNKMICLVSLEKTHIIYHPVESECLL